MVLERLSSFVHITEMKKEQKNSRRGYQEYLNVTLTLENVSFILLRFSFQPLILSENDCLSGPDGAGGAELHAAPVLSFCPQ